MPLASPGRLSLMGTTTDFVNKGHHIQKVGFIIHPPIYIVVLFMNSVGTKPIVYRAFYYQPNICLHYTQDFKVGLGFSFQKYD